MPPCFAKQNTYLTIRVKLNICYEKGNWSVSLIPTKKRWQNAVPIQTKLMNKSYS